MMRVEMLLAVSLLVALGTALAGARAVRVTRWLVLAAPLLAIITGAQHLMQPAGGASPEPFFGLGQSGAVAWLAPGIMEIGPAVDAVSAVMLLVVGIVAAMVVIFSVGYMAEDRSQARYFALLSAFTGAMSGLVVARSLLELFIAWELVGACSYLLIGFWFHKPSAARAAVKAFLVTRVGDVGLLLALALLWKATGTLGLAEVMRAVPTLDSGTTTTIALLLFVGAAGKSAQFPLHIWLPDAMEGPTPVSALIHAATMVAAGVFLVVRTWPVFEASPTARLVVLVIGCVTALGAAAAAIPQTDIKRVLAYSTISQLGFMFAALGAGAWQAAFFHLVTHAAFKSLLFLASGSVIHGSGTQDLREMGGLRTAMPVTAAVWTIGIVALAGIPPLAGFFSKDAIVDSVLSAAPVAGVALLLASACTALYAFRATRLAFAGTFRGAGHPHESPLTMTVPLVVLAVLAAGLGAAQAWFAHIFGGHGELALPVALTSTAIAIVFGYAGWKVGVPGQADGPAAGAAPWWGFLRSGYGVDGLVMRFASWTERSASVAVARFDRAVVDGAVMSVPRAVRALGAVMNGMQTGEGPLYASLTAVGAALLVGIALWMGR